MDHQTAESCISIAEDVKLTAEVAAMTLSYGELYGEQCKIEAAQDIIDRIRRAIESTDKRT